jgi:hypothetical protein
MLELLFSFMSRLATPLATSSIAICCCGWVGASSSVPLVGPLDMSQEWGSPWMTGGTQISSEYLIFFSASGAKHWGSLCPIRPQYKQKFGRRSYRSCVTIHQEDITYLLAKLFSEILG